MRRAAVTAVLHSFSATRFSSSRTRRARRKTPHCYCYIVLLQSVVDQDTPTYSEPLSRDSSQNQGWSPYTHDHSRSLLRPRVPAATPSPLRKHNTPHSQRFYHRRCALLSTHTTDPTPLPHKPPPTHRTTHARGSDFYIYSRTWRFTTHLLGVRATKGPKHSDLGSSLPPLLQILAHEAVKLRAAGCAAHHDSLPPPPMYAATPRHNTQSLVASKTTSGFTRSGWRHHPRR